MLSFKLGTILLVENMVMFLCALPISASSTSCDDSNAMDSSNNTTIYINKNKMSRLTELNKTNKPDVLKKYTPYQVPYLTTECKFQALHSVCFRGDKTGKSSFAQVNDSEVWDPKDSWFWDIWEISLYYQPEFEQVANGQLQLQISIVRV